MGDETTNFFWKEIGTKENKDDAIKNLFLQIIGF